MKYRCRICGAYFSTIPDIMSHLHEIHYVKVEYADYIEEVPENHNEPFTLKLEFVKCPICGKRIYYLKEDWVYHHLSKKFYHKKCLEARERAKEIK